MCLLRKWMDGNFKSLESWEISDIREKKCEFKNKYNQTYRRCLDYYDCWADLIFEHDINNFSSLILEKYNFPEEIYWR